MTLLVFFIIFKQFEVGENWSNPDFSQKVTITIMVKEKKKSVLIIDADQTILDGLSKRFKRQGMLVITAKDGYEGYTRACNEGPDFIICEILMPSMNGFRISRLIKFDERYKNKKFILMTSNDPNFSIDLFKQCKADSIIKKPFRFSHLLEKIEVEDLAA